MALNLIPKTPFFDPDTTTIAKAWLAFFEGLANPKRISYTDAVEWTGSVTNPSLGNGTLTASYIRRGTEFRVDIALTIGSTTTLGSGVWSFSLPAVCTTGSVGQALVYDASGGGWPSSGVSVILTTTTCGVIVPGSGLVGAASPIAWATGDSLTFSIMGDLA